MAAKCNSLLLGWPSEIEKLQMIVVTLEAALAEATGRCNHARAAQLRERLRLVLPLLERAKSREMEGLEHADAR